MTNDHGVLSARAIHNDESFPLDVGSWTGDHYIFYPYRVSMFSHGITPGHP